MPAALNVSEDVAGGTVEVCAEIAGASSDTTLTSTISASLVTLSGEEDLCGCVCD